MPGSSTTPGCPDARADASVHVAFRLRNSVSAQDMNLCEAQLLAYAFPLPTLRCRPCGRPRTAQGRCGSLLPHRVGLPPTTPCRSPRRTAKESARYPVESAHDADGGERRAHAKINVMKSSSRRRCSTTKEGAFKTVGSASLACGTAFETVRPKFKVELSLLLKQQRPFLSCQRLNCPDELCQKPWQKHFQPHVVVSYID